MKKKSTMFLMMLGAAMLTTSCLSEQQDLAPKNEASQKGKIVLNLSADASFDEQTRALSEANYRNTSVYTVRLLNLSNNNVMMECLGSELSDNLPKELELGSYEILAYYGTESDASRDNFRVEGKTDFTIKAKDELNITVACEPTCGKLSVNFADEMATYYDDYSVTYSGTAALGGETITWAKDDTEPWYVALGTSAETINYTLNLKVKDDYAIEENGVKKKTGTVTGSFQLQRNKGHKLSITPHYTEMENGFMKLTITIDESTNDKPITIEVPVTWI